MSKPNLGSEQDMDRAIGHTLAWWNHIESNLGNVFCAIFGGVNHPAARNAYLAVINFNARLQMVNASLNGTQLPKEIANRWTNLRNRIDKKSAIRNRLTHFSRLKTTDQTGSEVLYVIPNFWEIEAFSNAIDGRGIRYTWPEIWDFGQDFGKLAIELRQLAAEIEVHVKAHPPEFPRSTLDPTQDFDIPNAR